MSDVEGVVIGASTCRIRNTSAAYHSWWCFGCLLKLVFTRSEQTCWSRNEFETPRVPSVNGRDRNSCKRISKENPHRLCGGSSSYACEEGRQHPRLGTGGFFCVG